MLQLEITRRESRPQTVYKPTVILNMNAGSGRAGSLAESIRAILHEMNSDAEVVETRSTDEGRRAIQAAIQHGQGPLVVCGGDGTILSAANTLLNAGSTLPLGVVPLGTGNDYAAGTLGLPQDMRAALQVALHGRPRAIDVARVNDTWVTNIFAAGLAGNVAWDVQEMLAAGRWWARGAARYTISILRQILFYYHRLPVLEIRIDGKPWGTRQMLTLAAMIGPTSGGGYQLTPGADPYDGLLDILLMRRIPRLKALQILPKTKNGRHTGESGVELLRAKQILIRSDRPVQAHVDGDPLRAGSFDIRVVPAALTVMTPPAVPNK
jgi:diacylglycerol kinase (ATP)